MLHGGEIYDKNILQDLSVNLNPYPTPESLKEVLINSVSEISKYPDISQSSFRKSVAKAESLLLGEEIAPDNIIGANGASELIFAIIHCLSPRRVLMPVPGFYGYRHALNACRGIELMEHYLREENDFALGEDFADRIDEGTDLVIIANPNNPTGRAIDDNVLKSIVNKCAKASVALMVDESFLRLSLRGESAAKYLGSLSGLFIVSSFTKLFSVPGIRVGYSIASPENITRLKAYMPEWNMSLPAQLAGEECARLMISGDFLPSSLLLIEELRNRLTLFFTQSGSKVFPSDTCFVLIKSCEDLYGKYLRKGILIRDCSNFAGLTKGYYRISTQRLTNL